MFSHSKKGVFFGEGGAKIDDDGDDDEKEGVFFGEREIEIKRGYLSLSDARIDDDGYGLERGLVGGARRRKGKEEKGAEKGKRSKRRNRKARKEKESLPFWAADPKGTMSYRTEV